MSTIMQWYSGAYVLYEHFNTECLRSNTGTLIINNHIIEWVYNEHIAGLQGEWSISAFLSLFVLHDISFFKYDRYCILIPTVTKYIQISYKSHILADKNTVTTLHCEE